MSGKVHLNIFTCIFCIFNLQNDKQSKEKRKKKRKRKNKLLSPLVCAFCLSPGYPAGHSLLASWVDTQGAAAADTSWEPRPALAAPEWSPSPTPWVPRPSCSRSPVSVREGMAHGKGLSYCYVVVGFRVVVFSCLHSYQISLSFFFQFHCPSNKIPIMVNYWSNFS